VSTAGGSQSHGGALSLVYSTLACRHCTFQRNSAGSGGALYLETQCEAEIADSAFDENAARPTQDALALGGGLYFSFGSRLSLVRVTARQNSADFGGGLYLSQSQLVTVEQSSFFNNTARLDGGGIYSIDSAPKIQSSSFQQNSAAGGGGAMLMDDTSAVDQASVHYDSNRAVYGPSVATPPSVLLILSGSEALTAIFAESSQPFAAPITLQMKDALGNTVASDSVSLVRAISNVSMLGVLTMPVKQGLVQFNDLGLRGVPGQEYNLTFEVSLPSGSKLVSPAIAVRLAACHGELQYYDGVRPECQTLLRTKIPSGGLGVLLFAAAVEAVFAVLCFGVVRYYKADRVIHSASPTFLYLLCVGALLMSLAVVLTVVPQSTGVCSARLFLVNLAFMIGFGSLFLKTYRLHKIFNNPLIRVVAIKNKDLLTVLSALCLVDLFLLSLWLGVSPYSLLSAMEEACVSDHGDAFLLVISVLKGVMLVAGAVLTYKVRNVNSMYNESSYIAFAIYNVGFISLIWIIMRFGINNSISPATASSVDAVLALLGSGVTMVALFVPKFIAIRAKEGQKAFYGLRNVDMSGGRTTATLYSNLSQEEEKDAEGQAQPPSANPSSSAAADSSNTAAAAAASAHKLSKDQKRAQLLVQQFDALVEELRHQLLRLKKAKEEGVKKEEEVKSVLDKLGNLHAEIEYHYTTTGCGALPDADIVKQIMDDVEAGRSRPISQTQASRSAHSPRFGSSSQRSSQASAARPNQARLAVSSSASSASASTRTSEALADIPLSDLRTINTDGHTPAPEQEVKQPC